MIAKQEHVTVILRLLTLSLSLFPFIPQFAYLVIKCNRIQILPCAPYPHHDYVAQHPNPFTLAANKLSPPVNVHSRRTHPHFVMCIYIQVYLRPLPHRSLLISSSSAEPLVHACPWNTLPSFTRCLGLLMISYIYSFYCTHCVGPPTASTASRPDSSSR